MPVTRWPKLVEAWLHTIKFCRPRQPRSKRLNNFVKPGNLMQRRKFLETLLATGSTAWLANPSLLGAIERPSQAPGREPVLSPKVKRVFVVFKCHFDAGFIDTQANVVHRYFNEFFPKAIETAGTAPPFRLTALRLDDRILAPLRISRASGLGAAQEDGTSHPVGLYRVARAPIQLADRADGPIADLGRTRAFLNRSTVVSAAKPPAQK